MSEEYLVIQVKLLDTLDEKKEATVLINRMDDEDIVNKMANQVWSLADIHSTLPDNEHADTWPEGIYIFNDSFELVVPVRIPPWLA